jgi:hypothetical protein
MLKFAPVSRGERGLLTEGYGVYLYFAFLLHYKAAVQGVWDRQPRIPQQGREAAELLGIQAAVREVSKEKGAAKHRIPPVPAHVCDDDAPERGVNPRVLQESPGHKDISTTLGFTPA